MSDFKITNATWIYTSKPGHPTPPGDSIATATVEHLTCKLKKKWETNISVGDIASVDGGVEVTCTCGVTETVPLDEIESQ